MVGKYQRTIVTAALPYANGPIHIGHLAGNFLPADIYARYLRLKEEKVVFICGSDEHGVPISILAKKKGISPQKIVDEYHFLNKKNLEDFGISFDIFSRTSNEIHKNVTSDFFMKLYNNGKLIEKEVEQYYDEKENEFLADRYIRGTCPKCGYEDAYGDQCEKCGTTLAPNELINPRSFLSGEKPILKKTKHFYLPLKEYQEWLENWILNEHKNWKVNVYGQCKSWLKQGLIDRSITRDLDWGVKVPLQGYEGKVLYVWFDAPIGYISFTKELLKDECKDWWQKQDTRLVHFIGKDNIVFHCIVFPVMLKAHGDYILPDVVCGNEFMNLEGDKISTSRNHAIWLKDYLEKYPCQQDVLRYVLCANMPETKDTDFTSEDFKKRNNNELVATFGNFVNRTLVMLQKYFNGKVEKVNIENEKDILFLNNVNSLIKNIENNLDLFHFKEGLQNFMEIAKISNKYLTDNKPWHKIEQESEYTKIILNICIQVIAKLAIVGEPFLPFTSKKIYDILSLKRLKWNDSYSDSIVPIGQNIKNIEPLFKLI